MITEEMLLDSGYIKEEDSTTGRTYFIKQISDNKGIRYFIIVNRYHMPADKEYHFEGIVDFKLKGNEHFRVEKLEFTTETVDSMEKFFDYMFKTMICKRIDENRIITK